SACGVNLREQRSEDAVALLVRDAVDLRGPEMALKRLDHGRGRHIHLRTQPVAERTQTLLERDFEPVLARLRPEADTRKREPAPGKQLARIDLARGRHIGMAEHAFWRDRMARDDLATKLDHGFDLRVRE